MATLRSSVPLAAALFVLAAGSAVPYTLLTPNRTWDCPATYVVDQRGHRSITDADGGATATVGAIASNNAWNGAGAGRVLRAAKGDVRGLRSGDGVPMINFTDPLNACTGSCLVASFYGFVQRSAGSGSYRITDADIVLNRSSTNWTSQGEDPGGVGCSGELYIESIMVHEVGHTLGLGHSSVAGATMFPSFAACNNSAATTEADDEAGLRALYGTSPCATCDAHTQHLAGPSESDVQPCGTFYDTAGGLQEGWLQGPATADFDLALERLVGGSWVEVARSAGATSTEAIAYSAVAGRYRYRVLSASGSGTYHFWERHP